jgi:hypothetical protein
MRMLSKMMRDRLSLYNLAAYSQYVLDYQKNAFAFNAPTDVVRRITGREAELRHPVQDHAGADHLDAPSSTANRSIPRSR